MKGIYILIAVVVFASLRLYLRRRKKGATTRIARWQPSSDVALVAGREIRERIKTRAFRIATLVVLVAIAAAVIIPVVERGHTTTVRIGVVGGITSSLRTNATLAATQDSAKVRLTPEKSSSAAEAALRAGKLDLVVVGTRELVVERAFGPTDVSPLAYVTESLARSLGSEAELIKAGIPLSQAARLSRPLVLPVSSLKPASHRSTSTITSVYVLIFTYILLTQYGMWILLGVVEEKSNRIVEVILAAVTPLRLLAGKVIGTGLVALAQAAVFVGFAIALAEVTGSDLVKGTAASGLAIGFVWLILGYAFYCWLYAAVGSLIDRQDQVQTVALPVQLPVLLGYIVSFTAVGTTNPSLLIKVLAYLPITAPFAMPVLVSVGAASWWQDSAAALISVFSTIALARLAAAIYSRAILRSGRRIKARELVARGRQSATA